MTRTKIQGDDNEIQSLSDICNHEATGATIGKWTQRGMAVLKLIGSGGLAMESAMDNMQQAERNSTLVEGYTSFKEALKLQGEEGAQMLDQATFLIGKGKMPVSEERLDGMFKEKYMQAFNNTLQEIKEEMPDKMDQPDWARGIRSNLQSFFYAAGGKHTSPETQTAFNNMEGTLTEIVAANLYGAGKRTPDGPAVRM